MQIWAFWQEGSVKSLILRWPLRPVGLLLHGGIGDSRVRVITVSLYLHLPPRHKTISFIVNVQKLSWAIKQK